MDLPQNHSGLTSCRNQIDNGPVQSNRVRWHTVVDRHSKDTVFDQ